MDIQKCLPFKACENCNEFVLDVDEQAILNGQKQIEVVLKVMCKNEYLCRHLKDVLKDEE